MAKNRCKTVDALIRQMWAKMGIVAAQRAIHLAGHDDEESASFTAEWAEGFFEKAGGNALRSFWL